MAVLAIIYSVMLLISVTQSACTGSVRWASINTVFTEPHCAYLPIIPYLPVQVVHH